MIPGRAHFVWLGAGLPFLHVLAAASAARRGAFERVLFHHTDPLDREENFALFARAPGVEPRLLDPVALVEQAGGARRSEEHTSELQSLRHLVCRLLLEKKQNRT